MGSEMCIRDSHQAAGNTEIYMWDRWMDGREGVKNVGKESVLDSGMLLFPCFSKFLARTTFVLESLSEAKNLGQDAILGESERRTLER